LLPPLAVDSAQRALPPRVLLPKARRMGLLSANPKPLSGQNLVLH
jgi:hypothetical protein